MLILSYYFCKKNASFKSTVVNVCKGYRVQAERHKNASTLSQTVILFRALSLQCRCVQSTSLLFPAQLRVCCRCVIETLLCRGLFSLIRPFPTGLPECRVCRYSYKLISPAVRSHNSLLIGWQRCTGPGGRTSDRAGNKLIALPNRVRRIQSDDPRGL